MIVKLRSPLFIIVLTAFSCKFLPVHPSAPLPVSRVPCNERNSFRKGSRYSYTSIRLDRAQHSIPSSDDCGERERGGEGHASTSTWTPLMFTFSISPPPTLSLPTLPVPRGLSIDSLFECSRALHPRRRVPLRWFPLTGATPGGSPPNSFGSCGKEGGVDGMGRGDNWLWQTITGDFLSREQCWESRRLLPSHRSGTNGNESFCRLSSSHTNIKRLSLLSKVRTEGLGERSLFMPDPSYGTHCHSQFKPFSSSMSQEGNKDFAASSYYWLKRILLTATRVSLLAISHFFLSYLFLRDTKFKNMSPCRLYSSHE